MAATTKTGSQDFPRHHHPDLARPANPIATASPLAIMTNTTKTETTETYHPQKPLGSQAKKSLVDATRTDKTKTVVKAKANAKAKEGAARSNRLYLEHTDGGRGRDDFNIFEFVSQCGMITALERASKMPKAHQKAVHAYLVAAYTAELRELDQQAQPGNGYSGNSAAAFKQDQLRRDLRDAIQRHQQQAETFDEELRQMYTGDELNKRLGWADHWIEYGLGKKQERDEWHIKYAAKIAAEDAAKAKARAEDAAKARAEAAKARPTQPAQPDRQRRLGKIKQQMANLYGSNELFDCAQGVVFLDVTPDMDKLTAWTWKP
jgi:hypothetical protein